MKGHQETELELAWLVKYLPNEITSCKSTEIRQAYLDANDPGIKDIRIREKNGKFTYTVKKFLKNAQETGYSKEETRKLSKQEYLKLWKKAKKKIRKIRYYYPLKSNLTSEIDIYKDNLQGLIVVEVEFPSIKVCKEFKSPNWFGKEVTDSKGIYPPFIAELSIDKVNDINRHYTQKPHHFE